jgi:DNA-binding transcriptional LysR family regulator
MPGPTTRRHAYKDVRLQQLRSRSQEAGARSARLQGEPAYELDSLLATPPDHPLARRRRVEPRDLRGYPLVNAPEAFSRPEVSETLRKLGIFQVEPRAIEAVTTGVIRHYVALGFGVGLVLGLPGVHPYPKLHERSMSRYFGRAGISLVWRKGALLSQAAQGFAILVKEGRSS